MKTVCLSKVILIKTFFSLLLAITCGAGNIVFAQSVGIGTNAPDLAYKLNVAGNVKVNTNLAVLNRVGIGGAGNVNYKLYVENGNSYFGGNTNIGGTLDVTGSTIIDNNFRVNGRAGIGGATNASYQLIVHNGHSYFDGNSTTIGNATIGGSLNVSGSTIIDNNVRMNGRAGIGGATHGSYQLIVRNGNGYFENNATVAGSLNAVGDLTIKGNGHVRSNGPSSLRVGFDQRSINNYIDAGSRIDLTVNITEFSNGASDVRVLISQYMSDPDPVYADYYDHFRMTVHSVDPATNTCKLRIRNTLNSGRWVKGTIYFATVAKD